MSQERQASSASLAAAAAVSFGVPILAIAALVGYVQMVRSGATQASNLSTQATAQRIMPIGSVEIKAAVANAGNRTGEEVFKAQCATCHATGALGSPKFGDAAAWGPRIGAGLEALAQSAIKGKNNMTPQGGGDYTDIEITRAAAYMANAGGAKFQEPPAAAADAASAAQ
mgnify:CR=1 FL=1